MSEGAPGGATVEGQVAEVWQTGRQVGTLWDWHFEGHSREFVFWASRQSFSESFRGGEVEIRFLLTASSEHVFQMRGIGELTEYVVGEKRRAPARGRGDRLWTMTLGG